MFPKYEYRNASIYVKARKLDISYPARFHKHWEALVVKSGQLKVMIDAKPYTLEPGDVYVAFPNVLHSMEGSGAEAVVAIVDFELYQAFHDILVYNTPTCPVLRKGTFSQAVYSLFDRMAQLAETDTPYKQNTLAGYANALLGELLSGMSLVKRNVDDSLLQQLIFYFLRNYTRPIVLEDVAREMNYSKFYISRVVSSTFGCNFRTLINTYRVSMAQSLLVSSGKPISEIAYECGFKNQSSFNRIFLKSCGITPSDYRKKLGPPPEKPMLYIRD